MIDQTIQDRRLAGRLLSGDEEAFDYFVDEYYPRVYRFALSRLRGSPDLVDDVVQTTFHDAISGLSKYRGEASLFTWLCSITRYKIYEALRNLGKETVELEEENRDVRAALESLSTDSGAESILEARELASMLRIALDGLPLHYESALRWKYIDDLPVKEIAERMNVSPKAAESLLTRARTAFRDGFTTMTGQTL